MKMTIKFSTIVLVLLCVCVLAPPVLAAGPTFGQINVQTVPSGASIILDDKPLTKKSNCFILDVIPGIHTIHLSLEGYRDYEVLIDVSPNEVTTLHHEFYEAVIQVYISSKPTGAKTYINGAYMGKTDNSFKLKEGQTYSLLLTHEGYFDCSTTIVVDERMMQGFHHTFEALPVNGTIRVESFPEGAEIYLNDQYIGKSNRRIPEVPPGTYTIRLCKFGFDDYVVSVPVDVYEPCVVSATLRPKDGVISVESSPVSGTVYIDGVEAGPAPYAGEYAQGTHTVTVRAPGFVDFSQTVNLGLQGQSISAVLKPLADDAILKADAAIANNEKYNPEYAKSLLSTAKTQLDSGQYEEAYTSAQEAEKFANDVDGDYLPNFIDIQPNVKNDFIYAVPFVILFVLVGGVTYDWRRWRVHPVLMVEMSDQTHGSDPGANVILQVDNDYSSMVCTIYVDNKVIDNLATPGKHTVNLGPLESGEHTLLAKFSVQKKRYGTVTVSKEVDFEAR